LEIVPLCPFEAGAFLWEAEPGHASLTVLVKATFTLAPGDLAVARAQDPLGEERHFEDSALASLCWPGDYAPVKRKVDVVLVGHAYAPAPNGVDALVARLTVGDLTKAVRVVGDRVWTRDASLNLVPSAPAPFARMPIRYERAALSADNPVGFDANAPAATGMPARPNLEREGDGGIPCFGPISPQWRMRRRVLDESAMFWAYGVARAPREGAPSIGPAPPRFDFAFFNAAPPDQQIDLLRAGAPLVLEHLHPSHPRLEAKIPAMRPQVFRIPPPGMGKGRVEEIILRCDTVWIDTDRGVLVLTWRGLTDAPGGYPGVGTLVVDADPDGKKLRWDRVEKRFAEMRPPTLRLPAEGPPMPASSRRPTTSGPDPLAVRYDGRNRPPDGPSSPDATRTEMMGTEPLNAPVPDEPTNPLDPPTLERLPGRARRASSPPGPRKLAAAKPVAPLPVRPIAPPPVAPPKSEAEAQAPSEARASRPLMVLGSQPLPGKGPPPPVDAPNKLGGKPAPKPKTAPGTGPALRKDLGIERYGTICAELARRGADRAGVLKAHLLTEPAWSLVEQHWKRAMAQETEEGNRALQLAFDEAYLATQERLGQPVGVREYARIQVGIERGEVGRVLAELSLELGDLVRLQRVWTRRLGDSADLAAELSRAVDEARRTMP
jgi:hypothetical protein